MTRKTTIEISESKRCKICGKFGATAHVKGWAFEADICSWCARNIAHTVETNHGFEFAYETTQKEIENEAYACAEMVI